MISDIRKEHMHKCTHTRTHQSSPPRAWKADESGVMTTKCYKCMELLSNAVYRRKFRSQTSDNMDRWKAEMERVWEKRRVEQRRSEKRKSQKKEDADVGKGRKVAKRSVFQWFVAPEGRKVGSLKRRVRSHLARWEMKNCTPLWREALFEVKMCKTHQVRTTVGSCDVEKVHTVVARSTYRSQNVQNTSVSDYFWKLRCRKSARRCGAKHISKSKFKMYTTPVSEHFWKLRCRKSARRCGAKHISKSKC